MTLGIEDFDFIQKIFVCNSSNEFVFYIALKSNALIQK